jgi:hypothetical protein
LQTADAFLDAHPALNEEAVEQIGLGMLLMLAGAFNQNERPRLNVAICDQAGLGSSIWKIARQQTEHIFQSAGVDVTWIDLDAKSKCVLGGVVARTFIVTVLRKAPPDWTSPDAMGLAPSQNTTFPRAYIFYNNMQIAVDLLQEKYLRTSALGIMLGHAIAHELGHLLISGDAHSLSGIMSTLWHYEHWEDIVAGRLLFDERQAKTIRRTLALN